MREAALWLSRHTRSESDVRESVDTTQVISFIVDQQSQSADGALRETASPILIAFGSIMQQFDAQNLSRRSRRHVIHVIPALINQQSDA